MKCPICGNECSEENIHTAKEYESMLFGQICVRGNELAKGNLDKEQKEDLKLIIECARAVLEWRDKFEYTADYSYLAACREKAANITKGLAYEATAGVDSF